MNSTKKQVAINDVVTYSTVDQVQTDDDFNSDIDTAITIHDNDHIFSQRQKQNYTQGLDEGYNQFINDEGLPDGFRSTIIDGEEVFIINGQHIDSDDSDYELELYDSDQDSDNELNNEFGAKSFTNQYNNNNHGRKKKLFHYVFKRKFAGYNEDFTCFPDLSGMGITPFSVAICMIDIVLLLILIYLAMKTSIFEPIKTFFTLHFTTLKNNANSLNKHITG